MRVLVYLVLFFAVNFLKSSYLAISIIFKTLAILSYVVGHLLLNVFWIPSLGNECLILSDTYRYSAKHSFEQLFKDASLSKSCDSWNHNQKFLSQLPASSEEDQKLLLFLEKHWLSKITGISSFLVNWICPCFGVGIQVNPETTHCYIRLPSTALSKTYKHRMETWKRSLPQPYHFPLILTRPYDLSDYLPHHFKSPIQWIKQDEIGGIRLLSSKDTSSDEQFLLDWISTFGLSANRIELDRVPLAIKRPAKNISIPPQEPLCINLLPTQSDHPQKNLILKGTEEVLKGLLKAISPSQWDTILNCPIKSSIVKYSFQNIDKQLKQIAEQKENATFFDMMSHIEEIHAHLSSLLEVFNPFSKTDFATIYKNILTLIPDELKDSTSCGIHASGMTCLTGILRATKLSIDKPLCVVYGKNTYYEAIHAINLVSKAIPLDKITDVDLDDADLLLAHFNPVWEPSNIELDQYDLEDVSQTVHKFLNARKGRPLTLALDCTIDFIHSPRVKDLLCEFQEAIQRGNLNIVCYRSGHKFDLFGLDNYCGAPFYMIHNSDSQWDLFNILLTDPILQTDRLSCNWFCLAYQTASLELDQYRKQIFDNTRALLNKIHAKGAYKVVAVEEGADPAFIDLKVSGPFHQVRAAAVVAGYVYVECMRKGQPIFFRPSLGFYHPNLSMVFGKEYSSIRITLGLDPLQIEVLANCFTRFTLI